ncbi:MAG: phosphoglucomutase/phosphomannomutase family protein [Bacteroidia bacterium]|nr:phosphoglucomutase/phosphomannomutase family protein [Bacteroidia bacterium]
MDKIKFGTDGWRAIIGKDFTEENVARVADATGRWLKKNFTVPSCVIGHDCRRNGAIYAEVTARVLLSHGVRVYLAEGFVSTPMVSLGAKNRDASLGVVITASHNPPEYNGYKLKGGYGGPLLPEKIQEIEEMIPDTVQMPVKGPMPEIVPLEDEYIAHVEKHFDLALIRSSGLTFAYDAMYGAGQNVIRRLFPETIMLHCEHKESFDGLAPEPIHRNLQEFSELIRQRGNIQCGLATDGDADRIGLYDSRGNFIDSHHIILLLIKYLVEEKRMTGKVVTAFSVTPRVQKMCAHFGIPLEVVKIGFKYIAGYFLKEKVLLGGEESGGIAIQGHIPERDGLWMGFVIWEYMAKSGKSLEELIRDVYRITGDFSFERYDLHLDEDLKNRIVAYCRSGKVNAIGKYKVIRTEDIDGWKYYFSDKEWLMIRASGTEPVLRTYAESGSREEAIAILEEAKRVLTAI